VSELQHPGARSFDSVAELYERTRPSYPSDAVAWLVETLRLDGRSVVLDLGAGTGKLSRELVPFVGRVIAVEPGPAMLGQLERAVPEAEPVLGAAEAIPLPDGAVDAVTCGQSFHWFRPDEALPEIRRVLRRGGGLGLIWNLRDYDDDVQREVTALLDPFVPPKRPPVTKSVERLVERSVGEVARARFPFVQELDADALVDRIASISFVASASEGQRRELAEGLRGLAVSRGGRVEFRYTTEVYVTFVV
jgi:ubiquinone/menaquinone biosynthesis C-methylase UbiE